MPGSDLALLIDAARQAGRTARAHLGEPLDVRHKDHDNSPVTRADLAVNAQLSEILRGARPDYGWLSEESPDDPARLDAATVFIVDPIDGTRSFIAGERTWAHSLAVAHEGRVTAAVVFLPLMEQLYAARAGGGAWLNEAPIQVGTGDDPDSASVLAAKPSLAAEHWPGGVPALRRSHRPSIAYRLGLVAEGRYDAMITFRPTWEWDIAAGSLILEEAGAQVTDRQGGPIRFNAAHPQADGIVAANPALHAALLHRLR